jgi:hypothetical protein
MFEVGIYDSNNTYILKKTLIYTNGEYVLGRQWFDGGTWVSLDEQCISTNDGKYEEIYLLIDNTYVKVKGKYHHFNHSAMNFENERFIEASTSEVPGVYDVFISKDTGKVITEKELEHSFIDFIEKELLEIVYDYESGNQTGSKVHPTKILIGKYAFSVLKLSSSSEMTPHMRSSLEIAYINWLHYAEDYGGLLGNDEE